MVVQEFFKKYQRQILWIANNRLARKLVFGKTRMDEYRKIKELLPNGFIFNKEIVSACKDCKKDVKTLYFCQHKDKMLWERNKGSFFGEDVFSQRLEKGFKVIQNLGFGLSYLLKPQYAIPLLPLVALTSTDFNSTAGTSSPMDATFDVIGLKTSTSWAQTRALTGNPGNVNASATDGYANAGNSGSNLYWTINRNAHTYATGATIDAGATINSGSHNLICQVKANTGGGTPYWSHCEYEGAVSSPANTGFEITDFTKITADITYANITADSSTNHQFNLNATGLARVGKGAGNFTKLMCMVSNDIDNSSPTAGGAKANYANFYFVDHGTAAYHPILTIDWTAGVSTDIKSIDGLAKASVKEVDGLAVASVKSWNGLE